MMYPCMTLDDGTEIVHSQLIHEDGVEKVLVHFERPNAEGFDSARCEPPSCKWTNWEGNFSASEIQLFEGFLRSNAHLLYQRAACM